VSTHLRLSHRSHASVRADAYQVERPTTRPSYCDLHDIRFHANSRANMRSLRRVISPFIRAVTGDRDVGAWQVANAPTVGVATVSP
jgi:hypothetical protein